MIVLYSLLDDKRKELGDAANKLSNGLEKLVDTKQKVEQMSVELEETKVQLATFQKECDDYLIIIVQQKRDAEEQEKTVAAHSVKIAEEEAKCKVLADAAQKDLDEALPALEEAMKVGKIIFQEVGGQLPGTQALPPDELNSTIVCDL